MQGEGSERPWALTDYVSVIRRQKWVVLAAVVLVPALALVMSFRQQKLYEAKAQVLLSQQDLAASLTGTQGSPALQQSDRIAATDAKLVRVSPVLQGVLKAVPVPGLTVSGLRSHSHVSADPVSNILTFSVTQQGGTLAKRLATEYARQFTAYQRQLDSLPIQRALRTVESRLSQLPEGGGTQRALYESLVNKEQQLRAMEALGSANTFVVQEADGAAKVQPEPARSGALGLALGLLIGIGLAFLVEALDRRVRGHEEIEERLGLPLLARLRVSDKYDRPENRLVLLTDPRGAEAEAIRVFRSSVELANLSHRARTLMVTSALVGEGKTTSAANLAIALAQHHRSVILVDLDLRRPFVDRLFQLGAQPGLTDVVLGDATLDDALVEVNVATSGAEGQEASRNGHRTSDGQLLVLPSGAVPPDPGALVGTDELRAILAELRARADFVVIDTPPVLQVSDALSLSTAVDAIVVVTNLRRVTRPVVKELGRVLEMCPAVKLGFVIAGGAATAGYGYGDAYDAPQRVHGRARPTGRRSSISGEDQEGGSGTSTEGARTKRQLLTRR